MKGLEPPRLSAPDPKSGAATNYATSAFLRAANIVIFLILMGCKKIKQKLFTDLFIGGILLLNQRPPKLEILPQVQSANFLISSKFFSGSTIQNSSIVQ